jgi:hypothetical protein
MAMTVRNLTAEDRFWANVDRSGECWLWTGYVKPNGYASFYPGGGRHVSKIYAHRFSYELANSNIPIGAEIDHLCNVRRCVNPAHLEAVSHRENVDRAVARRDRFGCGHEKSTKNSYRKGTYSTCRECALQRSRSRRMSIVRGV